MARSGVGAHWGQHLPSQCTFPCMASDHCLNDALSVLAFESALTEFCDRGHAGMADPFDAKFGQIHKRGQQLAQKVQGSVVIVHRASNGVVQLSAWPLHVRQALQNRRAGRPALLRQQFGASPGIVVLDWETHQLPDKDAKALLVQAKQRREAWQGTGGTLVNWARHAEQLAQRPFLFFAMSGGETVCHASPEGKQLMASEWWREEVLLACGAPDPLAPLAAAAAAISSMQPVPAVSRAPSGSGCGSGRGQGGGGSALVSRNNPARDGVGGSRGGGDRKRQRASQEPATCSSRESPHAPLDPPEPEGMPEQPWDQPGPGEAPEQLLARLAAVEGQVPRVEEGSVEWYGQCLATNPSIMRPVQLDHGVFALPNYDPTREIARNRITNEPVQVGLSGHDVFNSSSVAKGCYVRAPPWLRAYDCWD